jgi:asparagine synthase (glutamine-hydrolysing)
MAATRPPTVEVRIEGEIFNAPELAQELGLPASSVADEVVRAGYRRWAHDVLARLRGSFALVVLDEERGRALVSADQGGGHSIYYSRRGRGLTIASEIKPLLERLPTRPAPDPVGVVHWFSDYAAPLGRTLYTGVEELPGGDYFELSPSGWRRVTYWQPRYEPDPSLSERDAVELLWATLVRAVGIRLTPDTGLLMSGGVDSAAVAAAAVANTASDGIRTYSTVFPSYRDDRVDESSRIDALAAALGVVNTQVRIAPRGAFSLALDWMRAWDLPLGGPGYLLEWPLLQLAASAGVVAILDGQGGDDGFAVSPFWLADLLRRGRLVSSVRMARCLPEGSSSFRDQLATWQLYALRGALPAKLHRSYRRFRDPRRHAPGFLTRDSARLHVETDEVWDWKLRRGVPAWWSERAFLLRDDRHAVGVGDYARRRAALAGLHARPPLLDPDLIDCLLRIPPRLGFDPTFDRVLIRKALAGRVPDAVRLSTAKSNLGPVFFDAVAGRDFESMRAVLSLPDPEVGAFVRADALRAMIDRVPAVTDPHRFRWMINIWRLATAECWLRDQKGSDERWNRLGAELPEPEWQVCENSQTPT